MAIGLDLGTNSIKVASLSPKDKSLDDYQITYLDLKEENSITRLKTGLKKILSEPPLATNKLVNIGVRGPSVVVRYPTLPKMSKEELAGAMRFELEQHIPFKKEEVEYDFQVLEEFSPAPKSMKIALAAVRKEFVEEQTKMITEAGLRVSNVDTDSTALINAFTNSNPPPEGEVAALINIGFETTNINILKGNEPFLSRDIQFGGSSLAKLIAKDKNIALSEADQILKSKEESQGILELAKENLETLANEIRLSFGYYESQFEKTISKSYLSGGTVNLLRSFLQEHLGIPVLSWDPTLNLKVDAKLKDIETDKPKLAVAIGLALRE